MGDKGLRFTFEVLNPQIEQNMAQQPEKIHLRNVIFMGYSRQDGDRATSIDGADRSCARDRRSKALLLAPFRCDLSRDAGDGQSGDLWMGGISLVYYWNIGDILAIFWAEKDIDVLEEEAPSRNVVRP